MLALRFISRLVVGPILLLVGLLLFVEFMQSNFENYVGLAVGIILIFFGGLLIRRNPLGEILKEASSEK